MHPLTRLVEAATAPLGSMPYRSDGVWAWLDDLDYYITEQSLRLPDSFVAAIERRGFELPAVLDVDPMTLSWPPTDRAMASSERRDEPCEVS